MADINMMNAAGLFVTPRGSLSQRNYHPGNVCSSHKSKGKTVQNLNLELPLRVVKHFLVFLQLQNVSFLTSCGLLEEEETFAKLVAKYMFATGHQDTHK